MEELLQSFYKAWKLISTFDLEIYRIIGLTLVVTISSTALAALLGLPIGTMLGMRNFPGKKMLVKLVNTLMGLPPVVAGLLIYLLLSRKGPLGSLQLLFTPTAMVIVQVLIILPIITGLTIAIVHTKIKSILETCQGLGLKRTHILRLLLYECRFPLISAVLVGYGRATSEVGAVILVGGNIQYHTRVLTTAIVLETGQGMYDQALAMGLILLLISFLINWIVQRLQEAV